MVSTANTMMSVLNDIAGIIRSSDYPVVTVGISSRGRAAQEYVYVGPLDNDRSIVRKNGLYGGPLNIRVSINTLYDDAEAVVPRVVNNLDAAIEGSIVDKLDNASIGQEIKVQNLEWESYFMSQEAESDYGSGLSEEQESYQSRWLLARIDLVVWL